MSQTYRLKLKSSVKKTICAEDSMSYPLELTEIIPEEDMKQLFEKSLESKGFEKQEDGTWKMELENGEVLVVDTEEMVMTVTVCDEKEVSTEVEVSGRGESQRKADKDARQRLQHMEQVTEERLETEGQRHLGQELSERLQQGEEDRLIIINEVLQEVYAESLKRKAATLGDVMDIREGTNADGQYELDIRVEL